MATLEPGVWPEGALRPEQSAAPGSPRVDIAAKLRGMWGEGK